MDIGVSDELDDEPRRMTEAAMLAHDVVTLEVTLMHLREERDSYQHLARVALDEVGSLTSQLDRALRIIQILRRPAQQSAK